MKASAVHVKAQPGWRYLEFPAGHDAAPSVSYEGLAPWRAWMKA